MYNSVIAFLLALLAGLGTGFGGIFVVATHNVSSTGNLPLSNTHAPENSSGRRKPHGVTINIQSDSDTLGKENILFMGRMQAFSAGVMIYLSVIDIIPESARDIGIALALIWMAIGVVSMCLLEAILEPYTHSRDGEKNDQQRMLHTSMVTFVGMALHNTLEGLSVYLSALKDIKFGLPLSIVIMLHNMAEGVAVAIPIYLATGNRAKVIQLTFFNGLFEPIGVIVAGFLLQSVLTDILLAKLLASVAGVMLFISFHELIPMALKYAGKTQTTLAAVAGTAICLVVLMIVDAVS